MISNQTSDSPGQVSVGRPKTRPVLQTPGPGTNLKTRVSDPLSGCVNETDFENGKRCAACKDGCVNAACLPTEREAGGRACWIAGWGITTEDFREGPPTSKYLRKHFRKNTCESLHRTHFE